jgi:transcriptional regulator
MYVPGDFAVEDRAALARVIRENPFGLLAGVLDGAPLASHLPFLYDGDRLLSHMARANPQWRAIDGKAEMLAVFSGPHAYVSPRWYQSAPAVPTWNYVAVHVCGVPRVIDDAGEVRALLDRLVSEYEGDAWTLGSQGEDFAGRMMRGIVAFELPVARIEGKFKLSQNRPAADRRGVIAGLRETGDPADAALAELMSETAAAD